MRQLKFRILYDDSIFIIDEESDFTIEFGNKGAIVNIFCSDGLIDKWKPEAVMQFTGLLDKEGVEIYEGDIVSDHVGTGVIKYAEKYAGFRVSYGDGTAKWFYDYNLKGERESIEVIGNIYNNPELLKE